MNFLIERCLFPIMNGNESIGQGFLADGYFITAAHIIKNFPKSFIDIGEQRIMLSHLTHVFVGEGDIEKDSKAIDIAIYTFDVPSVLHLSVRKPTRNDHLRNYCMSLQFDVGTNRYYRELSVKPASLTGEEQDNYFYCNCDRYKGSSGSPLVVGTEVVGIMHSGNDNGLCTFLRPVSFIFPEHTPIKNKFFEQLRKYAAPKKEDTSAIKKPSVETGYRKADFDYYGFYDYNIEGRRQYWDAFDGEHNTRWNID